MFDWEDFKFISFIGGILLAVVGGVGLLGYYVSKAQCRQLEQRSGYQTDYRGLTGCYVLVGGTFVPYDRWRVLDEEE